MSTPRSLTLTSLLLLILSHVSFAASVPPRQFGDDGSFNDIIASITSDLAFEPVPVTTELGSGAIPTEVAGGEADGLQDGTYVTKVSLVGGDEITLGPTGQSGVETVLGSLTFTVAGPPPASGSSPPASPSGAFQPSGSASGGSAASMSGSTVSGTSSVVSGTSSATATVSGSSASASITNSNSTAARSSTSSASKSTGSSTSTKAKSSSTSSSSSSASASASDSSSASPSHSIDVRFFTTGFATVLGGVLLGAWIV